MDPHLYALAAYPRGKVEPPKLQPAPGPVKGRCRYCGIKIGRGGHFHEKACKERKQ